MNGCIMPAPKNKNGAHFNAVDHQYIKQKKFCDFCVTFHYVATENAQ